MNWQRLDRDNTIKIIESVKSAGDAAALFSLTTSEVKRARLSFYDKIFAYRLTNFASLPSFTFDYLGDGAHFQHLDGTELPIYTVNDKGYLDLNDRTVVDYLEFFFSHVAFENDEMVLIQSANDNPLLDSLDFDSADAVISNHKPPIVSYDAGYDRHTVEADLYADGLVLRATIEVTASGRVSITDRKMIVNAVADSGISGIMA